MIVQYLVFLLEIAVSPQSLTNSAKSGSPAFSRRLFLIPRTGMGGLVHIVSRRYTLRFSCRNFNLNVVYIL